MNRQAYSVVFCVLLASGFVHEIRVKAATTPEFARIRRSADPTLAYKGRSNEDYKTTTLKIDAKSNANIISISNETMPDSAARVIIDISAKLCLVLKENNPKAVLINLSNNQDMAIELDPPTSETIEDRMDEFMNGLSPLLQNRTVVESTKEDRLIIINSVLVDLISNIEMELNSRPEEGVQLLKMIALKLIKVLQDSLTNYLETVEARENVQVTEDLPGYVNVLNGYGVVVDCFPGGVSDLAKAGITNLGYDNATTGLERLANLLRIIGSELELPEKLQNILNDLGQEEALLVLLGGIENTLTNGITKYIATVVGLLEGKNIQERVLQLIIQFLAISGQVSDKNKDLLDDTNGNITALISSIEDINATETLSEALSNAMAFQNGSLTVEGVNIPNLVNVLINGLNDKNKPLLQVLVEITLNLSPDESIKELCLPILIVLMLDLTKPLGVQYLIGLGIDLQIDTADIPRNVLKSTLSTQSDLAQSLKEEDLFSLLNSIPIVNTVLQALNDVVSTLTQDTSLFESTINSNPEYKIMITALFQTVTDMDLDAEPEALEKVRTVNHITDIDFLVSLAVTVTTTDGLDVHLGR